MRFIATLYVNFASAGRNEGSRHVTRGVHDPVHDQLVRTAALFRVSAANAVSFSDSRLISTLASAPVTAARARAKAAIRSDFMLGLVIGFSRSTIAATSLAHSATPKGTLVACFKAASMMPSAADECLASL